MSQTQNKKSQKTRMLVEGAMMVALATVLCYIRIFKFPWGGSITLFSMLPIILFSLKYGVKQGLLCSFVFSLIQFGQGVTDGLFGWGLTAVMLIACILLDYLGAYTVIGLAGAFRKKGFAGWILGTVLAVFVRFLFHFFSGVVIWHSSGKLWEAFSTENEWLYSFLYNGAYMLPELVMTVVAACILLNLKQVRKLLDLEA